MLRGPYDSRMSGRQPAAIVRASVADSAAIARIYEPYVTGSVVSFEEVAPPAAEIARRMVAAPRLPWLVALRSEQVVGYCYGAMHRARPAYRWSVETSVYLAGDERGNGTGRALYDRLMSELVALYYVSVFAGITVPNEASERFHQALGFERIGVFPQIGFKHGRWHDVAWWYRSLSGAPADPPQPRPWDPQLD